MRYFLYVCLCCCIYCIGVAIFLELVSFLQVFLFLFACYYYYFYLVGAHIGDPTLFVVLLAWCYYFYCVGVIFFSCCYYYFRVVLMFVSHGIDVLHALVLLLIWHDTTDCLTWWCFYFCISVSIHTLVIGVTNLHSLVLLLFVHQCCYFLQSSAITILAWQCFINYVLLLFILHGVTTIFTLKLLLSCIGATTFST
jgi:hypothetical protein